MWQDAIVTTIAAGAALVIVRRVLDTVRTPDTQSPACGNCASAACAPQSDAAASDPKPIQLHRAARQ